MILYVDVVNKIATFQKRGGRIVCGNSDYQIKFSFDREWDDYPEKTVRFIWGGHYTDVDITGDVCPVPILHDTAEVEVGVYAGELKTTTSAFIGCERSILCEVAKPSEENDRNYVNEAKEAADRAEAAAEEATERVEEAVRFSTEKVETATKEAADRAEAAAVRAEAAAGKVDITVDPTLEIPGMAADAKAAGDRLKILEQWMNSETYEEMTAKLYVNPSGSKEYGYSVTGAVLTWETSEDVSYVKLTLPNGTTVDKIINEDLTETPLSTLTSYTDKNTYIITASKTWTLNATRADGNKETKSPTATISRQYRVYWGLGTQEDGFDSDFITGKVDSSGNVIKKGLRQQGTTLTTSKGIDLTFSSANNQYVYYAIPTALGTPAFQIGDFPLPGGFEDGVKISVDTGFTDSNNNAIKLDYNLYRSSNLLANNEAFKVHIT